MNSRRSRWWLLCGLLLCSLFAEADAARNVCALPGLAPIEDGLGGTGHAPRGGDEGLGGTGLTPGDGVGGTGNPLAWLFDGLGGTGHREDGVGGTGRPRERVRIRGVVTGFASVCVDGLEVHYSPATPVRIDGRESTASALALGQVVDIEARLYGTDLQAVTVRVLRQLVGAVEQIDKAAGWMRVDGVRVTVPPRVAGLGAGHLRPGEPVMVSGLRQLDGGLLATRIERAPSHEVTREEAPPLSGGLAVLQGVVAAVRDGYLQLVNGPEIRVPEQRSAPSPGSLATVLVEIDGSEMVSRAVAVSEIDDLFHITGHAEPDPVEPDMRFVDETDTHPQHETPEHDTDVQDMEDLHEGGGEHDVLDVPEPEDEPEDVEVPEAVEPIEPPDVDEPPDAPDIPELSEEPEEPDSV